MDPARRAARSVLPRFGDNVRRLREAHRVLAGAAHRGEFVTAAAEWLLDNYHLVASEVRDVRQNLPRDYYRELPKLAAREQAGSARVYALAVELIRQSDSRLDRAQLVRWLDAFQAVAPLTIGELWAWPSMLKVALVENLRRLADETLAAHAARQAADAYVARFDAAGRGQPPPLPAPLHPALVVQLLRQVREYGPRLAAVRTGLDAHLAGHQATVEETVRAEHQREAAAQVSVANVITSLRLCATLDWPQFVEAVSLVERVLQRDPAGIYGRMEFLTRDRYRQAVEELADPSGEAQVRVALRAVESAREAAEAPGSGALATHVGYHLIGRGRRGLEADVAWRPGPVQGAAPPGLRPRHRRLPGRHRDRHRGAPRRRGRRRAPRRRLARVPARRRRCSSSCRPARWPSRRCSGWWPGWPRRAACRASTSRAGSRRTRGPWWWCRRSSPAWRAWSGSSSTWRCWPSATSTRTSTSPCWATSPTPRPATSPSDAAILAAARAGIEALNARLGEGRSDRFFLFHRARQWNPGERVWMGWERKRGKLEELNRLLRGATDTSFDVQVGEPAVLQGRAVRHHPRLGHPPAARRRPASWSASPSTRSTARASIRPRAGSPRATASSSRA